MRKAVFLMAVLLLSAVWVVAQTAGTQAGTPTQSPSQNSSTSQSSGAAQNPQSQPGTANQQAPGAQQNQTNPAAPSTSPNAQTNPATPSTGAASQPAGTQAGSTPQTAAGASQTIEGCLSGTPGEYSLTTKSGQVYALAGDGSLLGDHVGQDVRVTGAQTSGNSAAAAGTPATGAAAGTPATQGSATGGTPYGSTGTTGSQPGATAQSQPGTTPGQTSTASAANSGPHFQVSNLEKVSEFCNMAKPH
jgi:hypothetical protein